MIQDLGCEVVHIPGDCTGLVQPLDISYNKPFKTRVRKAWEEYMINNMRKNGSGVSLDSGSILGPGGQSYY